MSKNKKELSGNDFIRNITLTGKLGVSFLHRHPKLEEAKNIDDEHIIIDKKDYNVLIKELERMYFAKFSV